MRSDSQNPATTHFGYDTVELDAKQARVDDVFHRVAGRYDLMNDLMSAGLHRVWKRDLVSMLRPRGHFRHLDVAGGTGDVAFRVAEAGGPRTRVTVADINPDMLAVGQARAVRAGVAGLTFVEANAEDLPFPKEIYDGYTIAFGIRNVPRVERALAEAYRVLDHGGRFLCLEFSHVDVPGLDRIYEAYSFKIIPELGERVGRDRASYKYLVESIRRFPQPGAFQDMIEAAGFRRTSFRRLSGGIVAIHSGWKI